MASCDWCGKYISGSVFSYDEALSRMLREKFCSRKCVAEFKIHLSTLSGEELEARKNKAEAEHEKELARDRRLRESAEREAASKEIVEPIVRGCFWTLLGLALLGVLVLCFLFWIYG